MNDKLSFRAIDNHWVEEVKSVEATKLIPKLLVGLKNDLACKVTDDEIQALLSNGEGIVEEIKCSGKEGNGITDVFYKAIETFINREDLIEEAKANAPEKGGAGCNLF